MFERVAATIVDRMPDWPLFGKVERALYAGDLKLAWGHVVEDWSAVSRPHIFRTIQVRWENWSFYARAALAAAAGHPDALINLALVHLESGRPADAVPLLRTAVNASDGDRREEARYLLHVAFRDVEQHDRALEVLDEVPDRFLRRNEHLMEEAAGYLEERRRFDRSQRLWERLREMRARRGEL